jgi:hypothetical protein
MIRVKLFLVFPLKHFSLAADHRPSSARSSSEPPLSSSLGARMCGVLGVPVFLNLKKPIRFVLSSGRSIAAIVSTELYTPSLALTSEPALPPKS